MIKYLLGFLNNIFNSAVSLFALIDNKSKISNKSKINPVVKVFDSEIDDYSYVGSFSTIIYSKIGKFCSISTNCNIGLATHSLKNISTSSIFTTRNNGTGHSWTNNNAFEEYKKVIIGNDVWIGTNVTILGGVKIGNGVIIGTGSIVTKDIPDYAIAVGVPARVIKYRFSTKVISKLLEVQWWNMPYDRLKDNIKIFQINDVTSEYIDLIR